MIMSDKEGRFKITRRRLLSGVAATGAAAAGTGAGTWAYFQDTETSSGNTIEAGTLDLKISDSDEGFGDGVSGTWTLSNAKPGDNVISDVTLQNSGSLEADHVEFDISVTENESNGPSGSNEADTKPSTASGMAEQFEVTVLTYDGTNVLSNLSDANGNGIIDIGDIASGNDSVLDNLNPPPAANGGTESLDIVFRWAHDSEFDSSVSGSNNDYQGDELNLTVTMALHQNSSQNL